MPTPNPCSSRPPPRPVLSSFFNLKSFSALIVVTLAFVFLSHCESTVISNGSKDPAKTDTTTFACRGKTTCGQMISCEEATFYLRNCPNVEIDGDGDGVPCESQWCSL